MKLFARNSNPGPLEQEDVPRITVAGGYEPDRVVVAAGEPAKLVFHRRDRSPCSDEVVFADHGLRVDLAYGRDVVVELPPSAAGEYEFHCGMGMLRGRVVVR